MKTRVVDILTDGLLSGYAGGTPRDVERGGIKGKVSHVILPGNITYHDEWFAKTNGGGQELIEYSGKHFTRLYGGGELEESVLTSLGISDAQVGKYLVDKIVALGSQTRLFEDCTSEPDGDWQYKYRVTLKDDALKLTTGLETISYKDTTVHTHAFILTPVI